METRTRKPGSRGHRVLMTSTSNHTSSYHMAIFLPIEEYITSFISFGYKGGRPSRNIKCGNNTTLVCLNCHGDGVICQMWALRGAVIPSPLVIPAKAGIYSANPRQSGVEGWDSRFCWNDMRFEGGSIPNDTSTNRAWELSAAAEPRVKSDAFAERRGARPSAPTTEPRVQWSAFAEGVEGLMPAPDRTEKLILIDAMSLVFRAFYAPMQAALASPTGMPTKAIYIFVRTLLKLLKTHQPDYVAVAFDLAAPTFRDQLFQAYKANRPAFPEELAIELPYVRRF